MHKILSDIYNETVEVFNMQDQKISSLREYQVDCEQEVIKYNKQEGFLSKITIKKRLDAERNLMAATELLRGAEDEQQQKKEGNNLLVSQLDQAVNEIADDARMKVGIENTRRINRALAELKAAVKDGEKINNDFYSEMYRDLRKFHRFLPETQQSQVQSIAQISICSGKWDLASEMQLINWLNVNDQF